MEYVTLVVIVALAEYLYFMFVVGKARARYNISAPATTGDVNFERHFRVQANTIEQLIVFIPAVYLAGYYLNAIAAAAIGCFFIIGRILYYRAYVTDPARRGPGMVIGYFATVLLVLLALIGVVLDLL
jgi:glutathione S-transferase